MIRLIAAASSNGVIGRGGGMPWKHIAEDRDWLLSQIRGGVVVLGRRSFEETNRPLPGAKATVVVTRNPAMVPTTTTTTTTREGPVVTAGSLSAALDEASRLSRRDEYPEGGDGGEAAGGGDRATTWICGGEAIYREAMLLRSAELLYLTRVHAWCDGDTQFPSCHRAFFPETLWAHDGADANYRYTFSVLGRGGDGGAAGRDLVARHPPAQWK